MDLLEAQQRSDWDRERHRAGAHYSLAEKGYTYFRMEEDFYRGKKSTRAMDLAVKALNEAHLKQRLQKEKRNAIQTAKRELEELLEVEG